MKLKASKKKIIGEKEIEETIAVMAKIPSRNITRDDTKKLKDLR